MSDILSDRLRLVSQTWNPAQRLHVGNLAWAASRGDGSRPPDVTMAWGDPLFGFADIWQSGSVAGPAEASVHVSPAAAAQQRAQVVQDLLQAAPWIILEVSGQETGFVQTLAAAGFAAGEGAWFVQLWRGLEDLCDLDDCVAPQDYTIRSVDVSNEIDVLERVEVHRRAWAPARIKSLLGLELTGTETASSYSLDKHHAVMASPVYHPELDLVAVASDGRPAGYALGWLDQRHGSVLFEPIGTDPAHAGRGLGRALCAQLLRVARGLGAVQAVVGPRGDDRYPVPRRVYQRLAMREVAQFVPFTNRPV